MLALPALVAAPTPTTEPGTGALLLVAIVVGVAALVLLSIALDLRRLRRASKFRAVHGAMGATFTVMVVGGALAMTFSLGSAPAATADQPLTPAAVDLAPAPQPESIDTGDVTDPATDIQLPTLPLE